MKMKKILTLLLALTIVAASAALAPVSVFAAEPGWIYDFSTEGSAEDFSTQTSGASILSDGENGYTRFYSLAGERALSQLSRQTVKTDIQDFTVWRATHGSATRLPILMAAPIRSLLHITERQVLTKCSFM